MNKKIIFALIPLLVLGAAYKFVLAKPKAEAKPPKIEGTVYVLGKEFLVNLADGRFAKLNVALVLNVHDTSTAAAGGGHGAAPTPPEGYGPMAQEGVVRSIVTDVVTDAEDRDLISRKGREELQHEVLEKIHKQTDVHADKVGAQPVQADERLRVARRGHRAVEVAQRPLDDLDALVLVGVRALLAEAGGVEDLDDLVGHPGRRDVAADRLPAGRRLADLLGQLPFGRLERRLALLVQPAGRDLQEVGVADRLARLAHQVQVGVVMAHHRDRALVAHDLALDDVAVGVAEALARDAEDLAVEDRALLDGLELAVGCRHRPQPYPDSSSSNANVTSSMPCSEAWLTRSVGSWLRSVPLARFVHARPIAANAFASEPPPVWMRRGV
jgi:flagellar basal body-associated protein FliL